jgi:hypothetical protein
MAAQARPRGQARGAADRDLRKDRDAAQCSPDLGPSQSVCPIERHEPLADGKLVLPALPAAAI